VLPRRPGARFALEALFLALLALGAGLADLRPLVIVLVMAGAWVLVALAELSAERIDRSPLSYLQPQPSPEDEDEAQEVFGPRPEERTVVAPPEPAVQPLVRDSEAVEEVAGAAEESPAEHEDEPQPAPEPLLPEREPAGWAESAEDAPPVVIDAEQAPRPRRRRGLLRRREPEVQPEAAPPPRHVKLLPRRSGDDEASRASQEVAELFGSAREEDEPAQPEENRG
jgi:hypothetical protein